MDVIPLPERKKPGFLKASKEQVMILEAGFAASDTSSKEHIAALSAASGLPPKWISSWFVRQRKKGRIKTQQKATAAPTMSIPEIAAFKTEHSDPSLSEVVSPAADQDIDQKSVLSKTTTKRIRKTIKKRKLTPIPKPRLEPPFVSEPLPLPSVSRPPSQPSIQAQPQEVDPDSPKASFILREMVPLIYKPQSSNTFNPPPGDITYPIVTEAIARPNLSSRQSMTPGLASSAGAPSSTVNPQVYPWQQPVSPKLAHSGVATVTPQNRRTRKIATKIFETRTSTLPMRQTSSLRPLLPLNPPISSTLDAPPTYAHVAQPAIQEMQNRSMKENQPMYYHPTYVPQAPSKLRSSGPRVLPPLFASTDMTDSDSGARRHALSTTQCIGSPSVASSVSAPQAHTLPFVQPVPHTSFASLTSRYQHATSRLDDSSFPLDPTTAPLKHLDILAPFSIEDLSSDAMINLLLDEQLVAEDPFQAAMGLVLASQLGLNWDCS